MATIFQTPKKQKDPATGKSVAALDAKGNPVVYAKWRTVIVDHRGNRKTFTLSANRQQAQKQADMLEAREREIKTGLRPVPSGAEKAKARPYSEVAAEYMAWGNTQGGRKGRPWSKDNADKRQYYLDWWKRELKAETLSDMEYALTRAEKALQKLAGKGRAGKTLALYREGLFAFCLWCKERHYLNDNPFARLGQFDVSPRSTRRAMQREEIIALLAACPRHRQMLYETAFATGFRAGELCSLEPHSLDVDRCGIHLSADADKGRTERFQPISRELLERLVAYAKTGEAAEYYARMSSKAGREVNERVPATPLLYVPSHPARTLREDLKRAGIPVQTPAGRLDFHACRTAYINLVIDAGADVKTAQTLSRHSTPHLTMNVYGRTTDARLSAVAEKVGEMVRVGDFYRKTTEVAVARDFVKGIAPLGQRGYTGLELVPAGGIEPPTYGL